MVSELDLKLKNKIIMVAASSRGIGCGIAEAVAGEGARLSLASRSPEEIQNAASKIHTLYGIEARAYTFDAMDPDSIENWTRSTIDDLGGVDGMVVNAGGPTPGRFDSLDDDAWNQAYQLTLLSAVRMIRSVLPGFRQQRSGSILTVTSTSIKEPIDELLLSNVFRAGVLGLVKSVSRELAREGIRINNLVPGRIDTERVRTIDRLNAEKIGITVEQRRAEEEAAIPVGRYGTIQELGAAAAFLLSDAAGYITGTTLVVDGGKLRTVQ